MENCNQRISLIREVRKAERRENSLRRQVLRLQDKACEERKLQEFQMPLQYVAHFVFQLMCQTLNVDASSVSKNRLVLTCV